MNICKFICLNYIRMKFISNFVDYIVVYWYEFKVYEFNIRMYRFILNIGILRIS